MQQVDLQPGLCVPELSGMGWGGGQVMTSQGHTHCELQSSVKTMMMNREGLYFMMHSVTWKGHFLQCVVLKE